MTQLRTLTDDMLIEEFDAAAINYKRYRSLTLQRAYCNLMMRIQAEQTRRQLRAAS
jgi:hypothetical protein